VVKRQSNLPTISNFNGNETVFAEEIKLNFNDDDKAQTTTHKKTKSIKTNKKE